MADASVMIVEDDVIVAEDLRRNLSAFGYAVVGQAMDGQEAVHMARELRPDVVLMDICLKGTEDGIHAAKAIQRLVGASIIYVSAHTSDSLVGNAVRSGASGYVVKPFQLSQITSAIEIALHKRREARQLEPPADDAGSSEPYNTLQRLQAIVANKELWAALTEGSVHAAQQPVRITSRESEVIRSLLCHRRLANVADVMGISVNTARKHLKSAFRKLNVHSQDELVRLLLDEIAPEQKVAYRCH